MKEFCIMPKIVQIDTAKEFCKTYGIGRGDLLFVSGHMYERFFKTHTEGAVIVNYRNYVSGEPTDLMVEGIYKDIQDVDYERVIAVGGGTILDVAKLFALKNISPVVDLYEHKIEPVRDKKLVLVPTTCGTGSEVTNISILELTAIHTKMGLTVPELYADDAVLIPELLDGLNLFTVETRCTDKTQFLTRPDLGRVFPPEGMERIKSKCVHDIDVQIYVSDGLSSTAVEANLENI